MFLLRLTVYCTSCIARLLLVVAFLVMAGCGATMRPIEPIKTRAIEFQSDGRINNGKSLDIDVIYITYVQELRDITRVGPNQWFEGKQRGQWKFKESTKIKGGQQVVVKLDPLILKRTVLLVVFANYQNTTNPSDKQVIVDYAGRDGEIIWVNESNLEPKNKSLQYLN